MKLKNQQVTSVNELQTILQEREVDAQILSTTVDFVSEYNKIIAKLVGATIEDVCDIIDELAGLDDFVKNRFDYYGRPENKRSLRLEVDVHSIYVKKQKRIDENAAPSDSDGCSDTDSDNME